MGVKASGHDNLAVPHCDMPSMAEVLIQNLSL